MDERRSEQINNVLSRARASVEPEVWKMVLEMRLGKVQAQDITFDKIGGKVQEDQRITVHKLPPNLSTLQMWLKHHSPHCLNPCSNGRYSQSTPTSLMGKNKNIKS